MDNSHVHSIKGMYNYCLPVKPSYYAIYFKSILKMALKLATVWCYGESGVGPESGPLDPRAWTLPHLRISDPPKSASLFRTLYLNIKFHSKLRKWPIS